MVAAQRKSIKMVKDSVEFYQHQADGVRIMYKLGSCILGDDMGLGKLQPVYSPVLTPTGWTKIGHLEVGDAIIGANGHSTRVSAIYPQGNKTICRVTFSDGSSTLAGWEHLWNVKTAVQRHRGGEGRVLTLRQIVDENLHDANGNSRHFVPMVEPVHFAVDAAPPMIDPYVLGVLLGDGCLSNGYADFVPGDDFVPTEVRKVLPSDVTLSSSGDTTSKVWRIRSSDKRFNSALLELNLAGKRSWEKFIPSEYLWASLPEDRLSLLHGLMDTDGYANPDGCVQFSTSSSQLADGVQFIVNSLGGIARRSLKAEPKFTHNGVSKVGRPAHILTLALPEPFNPFRAFSDRYVSRIKYPPTRSIKSVVELAKSEAVCIAVEAKDHLYVTDDFIVTHNTLQSLTVAALDFEAQGAKRVLVIAPPSVKWQWYEEIKTFTNFKTTVLEGTPKKRAKTLESFDTDVLIVNYEQILPHLDELNAMQFDVGIFDEAHYLKGQYSKRSKAARKLDVKRIMLLTGSPILNQVDDLFPLLNMVDPEEYSNYYGFISRYGVMGGFKGKRVIGVKNAAELNDRLQQVMLRRRKQDVLDLPDKMYTRLFVNMHPAQAELYDEWEAKVAPDKNPGDLSPMEVENEVVKLLRMKQIAGTPAAVDPTFPDNSFKLDLCTERTKELIDSGERIVIFTQFRGVQRCVIERLRAEGMEPYFLNGDVKYEDRIKTIKAWGDDPKPQPIVCMLQVAAVGLNMTAARTCIFLDKLWSSKMNTQAEDRMHRIGASTSEPVQIISIVCRGTVEQLIERTLARKNKVFNTVVEEDEWKRKLLLAVKDHDYGDDDDNDE